MCSSNLSDIRRIVDDVDRARVVNYEGLTESGEGPARIADDRHGPEDLILDRERKAYLMDAVDALPERLRRVVVASFFEDRPMHEIGAELGVDPHVVQTVLQQHITDLLTEAADRFDPPALRDRGADG